MAVMAAAGGTASVQSSGVWANCWVEIQHGGGWSTRYYHLKNVDTSINGHAVSAGQRLGDAGQPGTETCGSGSAGFRHVHFAVYLNGVEQAIDGTSIGGYTVHQTGSAYCGYWTRNSDGAVVADARTTCWAMPSVVNNQLTPSGGGGIVDGQFISYQGNVYRITGGAPVYVSSWTVFGGEQSTTAVTDAQWQALRWVPSDGTLVSTSSPNAVYRFAGGAPIYVSSWDRIGGQQPTVAVDPFSLDHTAGTGELSHVRQYPADGTVVNTDVPNAVYKFAGGAPIYVSSWDRIGGTQPSTQVDAYSLEHYTPDGIFSHVRQYPADGTYLKGSPSGLTYSVTAGVPAGQNVPANRSAVVIDDAALDHGGESGIWMHLKARAAVTGPTPTIAGQLILGATLTADAGSWLPAPVTLTYQWLRNGAPVAGATAPNYTLTDNDVGAGISVTVSGSRPAYRSTSLTSATTGPIANPASSTGTGTGGGSGAGPATGPPTGGPVAPPAAIGAAQVAFPAKKTALISWAPPANATSYQVRLSKKNSTKKWNAWTTLTATSVRLTKLKKRANYRVQITPVGPGGTGATTTWRFKQKK